jgi:hypothetical protein
MHRCFARVLLASLGGALSARQDEGYVKFRPFHLPLLEETVSRAAAARGSSNM